MIEVSSPVLKGGVRKFSWQNFHDFCVIHENHKNIRPRKFGAIRYKVIDNFYTDCILFIPSRSKYQKKSSSSIEKSPVSVCYFSCMFGAHVIL